MIWGSTLRCLLCGIMELSLQNIKGANNVGHFIILLKPYITMMWQISFLYHTFKGTWILFQFLFLMGKSILYAKITVSQFWRNGCFAYVCYGVWLPASVMAYRFDDSCFMYMHTFTLHYIVFYLQAWCLFATWPSADYQGTYTFQLCIICSCIVVLCCWKQLRCALHFGTHICSIMLMQHNNWQ